MEIAARRRKVDERTFLLLLDDIWFRVEVEVLPETRVIEDVVDGKLRRRRASESRYDVVLKRSISRTADADLERCKHLYGSTDLHAVSKRQISTREIRVYGLR